MPFKLTAPSFFRAPCSLAALMALGLLTGCVTQPALQPQIPAAQATQENASAQTAAATSPSQPETASAPPSDAAEPAQDEHRQPIIMRGSDEVVRPARGGARAQGPVSAFKFEDAPVGEVIHVMLRDLLKVDYIVHPPLNGRVTLVTRGEVSADRAMNLLESALQLNGIVMARDAGGTYHVGTPAALKDIVAAPRIANDGPMPPGYGAIIIPLQYLGAAEMANILRAMTPPEAIVRVDTLRNILIMRGTRSEAQGWMDVVKTFDVNLLRGMSVGVFPLQYASPIEVQSALALLSGSAPAASMAAPSAPQAQAAQTPPSASALGESSPLFGALRVIPLTSINAVLVITPRSAYLDEVQNWISKFDRPNINSAEPQLFVYKIKNGSADHLAALLNGIYGGSMSQQPGAGATGVAPGLGSAFGQSAGRAASSALVPASGGTSSGTSGNAFSAKATEFGSFSSNSAFGGSGSSSGKSIGSSFSGNQSGGDGQAAVGATVTLAPDVRVMADRINNTLLVYAPPAEYTRIEATLNRLDVQRAQVLLEAAIIEVTLADGLEYGVQWAFHGAPGGGSYSDSGVIGAASGGSLAATGTAARGFTYTLRNSAGNIAAVLSALASKSLIKVISNPSVIVMDNHPAAIQVGTQQPVNTGTTISGSTNITTTNIQYKDTGVMLQVMPSISAGDLVTLDINQVVSKIGTNSSAPATAGYPTFDQREINSKVAVRSGETLVLGGLIENVTQRANSGVPLLSSIPVLGALFGTQNQEQRRTELLVVITPRVLRSDEDARAVSRELRDRMKGLSIEGLGTTH